jgi:hypothetical protein
MVILPKHPETMALFWGDDINLSTAECLKEVVISVIILLLSEVTKYLMKKKNHLNNQQQQLRVLHTRDQA